MGITNFPNGVSSFGEPIYGMPLPQAGTKYFVSRNVPSSGNGKSWLQAFKTINEAITAVNLEYANAVSPTLGRNTVIYIGEGWYAELPQTLTASDCTIIVVSPGNHDSTVLYGVPVAGTFSGTAGGPALKITGSNNTVMGLGLYTSDPLYPSLRNGANLSDPDGPAAFSAPTGNKFLGLSFIRDVADGSLGGMLDYGGDGTLVDGCFFSTSCKDYGIRSASNGDTNPVNLVVRNSRFIGTPTGILQAAGHNGMYYGNIFMDDTSDRDDTCDTPIVINATSGMAWDNWAQGVNAADVVTGTGTISEIRNWGDDTT